MAFEANRVISQYLLVVKMFVDNFCSLVHHITLAQVLFMSVTTLQRRILPFFVCKISTILSSQLGSIVFSNCENNLSLGVSQKLSLFMQEL